jgi:predicted DNA-binding ribbon-helix-helix protein
MCEVFISANPQSYQSRTRSVRLHGVVTSIRLENLHWEVLEEIGQRDGMNVTQLLERLYDELVQVRGEVGNFASFLRVSTLRYMALQAYQRIPTDTRVSIRSLDARKVLERLPPSWAEPDRNRRAAKAALKGHTAAAGA